MKIVLPAIAVIALLLIFIAAQPAAIGSDAATATEAAPVSNLTLHLNPALQASATLAVGQPSRTPRPRVSKTPAAGSLKATGTATPQPTPAPTLDAAAWKDWPLMPLTSLAMRAVYQRGLAQGTIDPHAFSVLGDCQSESIDFLGMFENNPAVVDGLSPERQAVVAQFAGSFDRYNPAAKSGSAAGSLLYAAWNDNEEGACLYGETPIDCELRVHRPSIVFIHTGTHYETESRNWYYMTIIIDKILERGAVPVLVTKADNLELDEHINRNFARLALQYGLPLWNFWSSVQDLPEHGLMPNKMHLTPDAHAVHRLGALDALYAVWHTVAEPVEALQ